VGVSERIKGGWYAGRGKKRKVYPEERDSSGTVRKERKGKPRLRSGQTKKVWMT